MFLILILVIFCNARDASESGAPNIIYIMLDDLGWSDVGWNNEESNVLPYLTSMANNGTILEQSYSCHRCTPSRAAFLTGRYPFRYGLGTEALEKKSPVGLDTDITLFPKILRQNGYKTHIVGKWHLGFCQPGQHPLRRGFDTFFGFHSAQIGYSSHVSDYFDGFEPANNTNVYSTIDFTTRAIKLAKKGNNKNPFFLYLAYNAPHIPLSAPKAYITKIKEMFPNIPKKRLMYVLLFFEICESYIFSHACWSIGRRFKSNA